MEDFVASKQKSVPDRYIMGERSRSISGDNSEDISGDLSFASSTPTPITLDESDRLPSDDAGSQSSLTQEQPEEETGEDEDAATAELKVFLGRGVLDKLVKYGLLIIQPVSYLTF